MNSKNNKTKKFFKKGGVFAHSNVSWKILVAFAVIFIVYSFIFGFKLFVQTNREFDAVANAEPKTQIMIVKKERIQKVLEYFIKRQEKSTEIINSPSPIVDPSL